jgi:hypothetical protein
MAADLSDFLTVYIDKGLLLDAAELNARGDHRRPGGGPLLSRWVLDTYRALVHAWSHDDQLEHFDPALPEHQQTFLYSVLNQIEDAGLAGVEEALQILRDAPMRFIGLIEHVLATASSDRRLLELRS